MAPLDIAAARCKSLDDAVTNITGVGFPSCRSIFCMLVPLITGIATSETIQTTYDHVRRAKAVGGRKGARTYASARPRLAIDSRTNSSSSTIDIRIMAKGGGPDRLDNIGGFFESAPRSINQLQIYNRNVLAISASAGRYIKMSD